MPLFPRADLETFGFGVFLGEQEILAGLYRLARLQHLHRAGYWNRLIESNVEQSFVERAFSDIFGYRTLLSSNDIGDVNHEVMPKLHVPLPGTRGVYPDFALGHFRADQHQTVITAELKSPGADLDRAQTGPAYQGRTPVQQAMHAAEAAGAEWCIVSNTDEVRLYRIPNDVDYEGVRLTEVVSPLQFRRAYTIFSRHTLLGKTSIASIPSPLSRLYAHVSSGGSMLVPPRNDRVRLVQRARPNSSQKEFPFTRLSASLQKAFASVPDMNVLSGEFLRPVLNDEQLVFDRTTRNDTWQRIAVTKAGLLACSYSIPLDSGTSLPDQPIIVDPAEVGRLLADMAIFACKFFEGLHGSIVLEWSLEDLNERVRANDAKQWMRPASHISLVCQPNIPRIAFPEVTLALNNLPRAEVIKNLSEVIGELFFPFQGIDTDKRLCRLEPTPKEMHDFLQELEVLRVLP